LRNATLCWRNTIARNPVASSAAGRAGVEPGGAETETSHRWPQCPTGPGSVKAHTNLLEDDLNFEGKIEARGTHEIDRQRNGQGWGLGFWRPLGLGTSCWAPWGLGASWGYWCSLGVGDTLRGLGSLLVP